MTKAEKEKMVAMEMQIKKLATELQDLKRKQQNDFEMLETDSSLVQTYN